MPMSGECCERGCAENGNPCDFQTPVDAISTVVNLTPHRVSIGSRVIPAAPAPARIEVTLRRSAADIGGMPAYFEDLGAVTGLPAARPRVTLIVSRMVRDACPERRDLASPVGLVRDASGRVVGAMGLAHAPIRAT